MRDFTTGIEEVKVSIDPVLYPNPCCNKFTINLGKRPESEVRVEIYNVTGKLVQQLTIFEQENLIPFSFAAGLYFVRIRMGEAVILKKLLVK